MIVFVGFGDVRALHRHILEPGHRPELPAEDGLVEVERFLCIPAKFKYQ